ncbi:MAG: hypothetical protein FWC86_02645 [Coriobacteriia bacterium]|nr:hypothetical protein [Coriobacteriia bacterium]
MRIQKGSVFVLALTLFTIGGLFAVQADVPSLLSPVIVATANAAEVSNDEEGAGDETEAIEAISDELYEGELYEGESDIDYDAPEDGAETAVDTVEEDVDDSLQIGWLPLLAVLAGLIASGGAAFFIATKKKG